MNYNIIILSILLFILIIYENKPKFKEKNTNTNDNTLKNNIKENYLFDLLGLKNFGYLCEKIYNKTTNTLELPYNVKIEGTLNARNITAAGYGLFGIAKIGSSEPDGLTTFAIFSHTNHFDDSYALKQDSTGNTILNYKSDNDYDPTTKEIRFRMNNNDANGKIQIAGIKGKDIDEKDIDGNTIIGNVKARRNLNFVEQINSSGNKFRIKTDTNNCFIQTENNNFRTSDLITGNLETNETTRNEQHFSEINLTNGQKIIAKTVKALNNIYIRRYTNDNCIKFHPLKTEGITLVGSSGSEVRKNYVLVDNSESNLIDDCSKNLANLPL